MMSPKTLFNKVWQDHLVAEPPGSPAVLYIDLHLVHEVTSPQAFSDLARRGLKVRRPERTMATIDHGVPTFSGSDSPAGRMAFADELSARQIHQLEENCRAFGICLYDLQSENQGIVHVISLELGLTRPGMTIVCGDSHTATHGAFGTLAFGIGTSEVEHVLATQCLLKRQPSAFEVRLDGRLGAGVTAKDVILAVIHKIGVGGGTGCVIEYTGEAIRALGMEGRMTICNMSIEAGARAGMVAPDDVTYQYLAGRPFAPQGEAWEKALARWRQLPTDEGAAFDRRASLDVSTLEPMITFGTNPGMGMPVSGRIPRPEDQRSPAERSALEKALAYMRLQGGDPLAGHPVGVCSSAAAPTGG